MLPLKVVRSLVLGEPFSSPLLLPPNLHDCEDDELGDAHHHHSHRHHFRHKQTRRRKSSIDKPAMMKTPSLLFLPTKELVTDTYRLASLARDIGMDLYPTPSLSHIIFSYPSSSPSPSSSTSTSTSTSSPFPLSWSSSSSFWSLPDDAVPLPFPSLTTSSLSNLRFFVGLSKGLFKLVFISSDCVVGESSSGGASSWNCCSISLFSRLTGDQIKTMEEFSQALAGKGWTLYKTKQNPPPEFGDRRTCDGKMVFLFKKMDSNRVRARQENGDGRASGKCRIRELRLPELDFGNAPLRILQYILLMTDDVFYLV